MILKNLKTALALGAITLFGALSAAAPAAALSEPLYDYIYYSDATKTSVVGTWSGVCYNGYAGVAQYPDGQVTPYYDKIIVGQCTGDGGTILQ